MKGYFNVKIRRSVFIGIFISRQFIFKRNSECNSSFISPASGDILHSVASSSQKDNRNTELQGIINASSVASCTEIELTKFVFIKRIGTTLQNNSIRLEFFDNLLYDILIYADKALIINARVKWDIKTIAFTVALSDWIVMACSREEVLSVLMERNGHDSVGCKERFLNAISVMHVNINVQNSWVIPW